MGPTPVKPQPPRGEFLPADEFIGALNALPPDDKLKLDAIEWIRRRDTAFAEGELIHEAVSRTLVGSRNCPRDVPLMAFLSETMRSIAGHDRKRRRRLSPMGEPGRPADKCAADHEGPTGIAPSPEDDLLAKEEGQAVQAIFGDFDDDEQAQLVLIGWQDDLGGAALREGTGLNQTQLDYAIRRIRTRMRREYPQGWKP
jgi:DNA-directed RNA polymerase specialized sigma24 family protein